MPVIGGGRLRELILGLGVFIDDLVVIFCRVGRVDIVLVLVVLAINSS